MWQLSALQQRDLPEACRRELRQSVINPEPKPAGMANTATAAAADSAVATDALIFPFTPREIFPEQVLQGIAAALSAFVCPRGRQYYECSVVPCC